MRPRSLCDGKLLAVTPAVHQVKNNDHSFHAADDRPPIPPHRTPVSEQEQPPVPPRPPPMVPTRAPRAVQVPTKFRGSWPYAMTPSWNAPDPDLTPYPSPLSSADKSRCPSMAGLLNTTVPQRLAVPRPARGHHTPTRHSLRHSRMISLSQQGRGQLLPRILFAFVSFFEKKTMLFPSRRVGHIASWPTPARGKRSLIIPQVPVRSIQHFFETSASPIYGKARVVWPTQSLEIRPL